MCNNLTQQSERICSLGYKEISPSLHSLQFCVFLLMVAADDAFTIQFKPLVNSYFGLY